MKFSLTDRFGRYERIHRQEIDEVTNVPGLGRLVTAFHAQAEAVSVCPSCSWTLADAQRTSLMGCPVCYTVLWPIYNRIQAEDSKSTEHSPE